MQWIHLIQSIHWSQYMFDAVDALNAVDTPDTVNTLVAKHLEWWSSMMANIISLPLLREIMSDYSFQNFPSKVLFVRTGELAKS